MKYPLDDNAWLARIANNGPADYSGWNVASALAQEVLRQRGIDYLTFEYLVHEHKRDGKTGDIICRGGRFVRWADEVC